MTATVRIVSKGDPVPKRGVMLALSLPLEVAKQIALEGGEDPEAMHCTLAYMGRADDLPADAKERALSAARSVAAKFGPVLGLLGGIGRFNASTTSDGKDVVHAMLDAPLLPALRHALVEALDAAKLPPKREHGYSPHVTLRYQDTTEGDAPLPRLPTMPVVFPAITLSIGEDRVEVPLSGERITKSAFPNGVAEVGIHVHNLERENARTKVDGAHRHLYVLPDGSEIWTDVDGEHEHPLPDETANETDASAPHRHKLTLPDGTVVETEDGDGAHRHQLQVWSSAFDGLHVHRAKLPDGSVLTNPWGGDYWEGIGAPDQADIDEAPAATELEKREPAAIQTLIFDKGTFDREQAIAWVGAHDFDQHKAPDETGDSWRIRQRDPGDFESSTLRTMEIRPGVKAVVGQLRKSRIDKARGRSSSYLEAVLEAARKQLPGHVWQQVHAAALPSSGGRARWYKDDPNPLEQLGLAEIKPEAIGPGWTDDALLDVWGRLHRLFASATRRKSSTDALVCAARPIRAELLRRGRKLGATSLAAMAAGELADRKLTLEGRPASVQKALQPLVCFADEKRLIYAIAMEPDAVDAHGEKTTALEVERAAHWFMQGERGVNVEHKGPNVGAEVVESFVAPFDLEIGGQKVRAGSWVVAIHVTDDALWKRAKAGEFGGVSIEGWATRSAP